MKNLLIEAAQDYAKGSRCCEGNSEGEACAIAKMSLDDELLSSSLRSVKLGRSR